MSDCLHTRRLILRPYVSADAGSISELIGDWDVARWLLHVPYPYAEKDAEQYIRASQQADDIRFAITLNGRLIGGCSIRDDLGYWLGKPFWGQGHATEAMKSVVHHYFARTASDLNSGHMLDNTTSRRVLEKLGFEDAAQTTQHCTASGKDVDVQKMRLTHKNWETHK